MIDTKQGGVSMGEEGGGGFQFGLALQSNPCSSVHTSHRSPNNGLDDYTVYGIRFLLCAQQL